MPSSVEKSGSFPSIVKDFLFTRVPFSHASTMSDCESASATFGIIAEKLSYPPYGASNSRIF
jgi:hypothetical protein